MKRSALLALFSLPVITAADPALQPAELAPVETGQGILFRFHAPDAEIVHLAGDWNDFASNLNGRIPDEIPGMNGPDTSGLFQTVVKLPPGIYVYKFALNRGDKGWVTPAYERHRDEHQNAYLLVDGKPDAGPKAESARPPFTSDRGMTFEYFNPDAHIVFLAGSFNNWADNRDGRVTSHRFAMSGPDEHGIWRKTVPLTKGRHLYQFVIDGSNWIRDPLAPDSAGRHAVVEMP